MPIPGGSTYDPDKDYRLLHDEVNEKYYIQKKRFFFGWKFVDFSSIDIDKAKEKLTQLRKEKRKIKVKKRFVVLNY